MTKGSLSFSRLRISPTLLLTLGAALALVHCGPTEPVSRRRPAFPWLQEGRSEGKGQQQSGADRRSWETFSTGRDLQGGTLSLAGIEQGDQLLFAGKRDQALLEYAKVDIKTQVEVIQDAITYRRASTELSLDHPDQSLKILSSYFRSRGANPEQIGAVFSILFGYAYGRKGNIDQSLAWFSRAYAGGREGGGGYREAAQRGIRTLLRAVSADMLEVVAEGWKNDSLVHQLISEDRARRAKGGRIEAEQHYRAPFWEEFQRNDRVGELPKLVESTDSRNVIAIALPLSGQYGSFGTSLRNGLELAFSGMGDLGGFQVEYRDIPGTPVESEAAFREMIGTARPRVIVGPLLADSAELVAGLARSQGITQVAFTKKSDFATGQGVFRIAPIVEDQIASLFQFVGTPGEQLRIAVVAPDDVSGEEFARVFREHAEQLGHQIVFDQRYTRTNQEALLALAADVERVRPQAIFFPDSILNASRFFSALAPAVRARVLPLGCANWDDSAEIIRSAAALEGATYPSLFAVGPQYQNATRFVEAYREKYGVRPDFLAAQGFDTGILLGEALRGLSQPTDSFADSLARIELSEGLTGKIRVLPNGEIHRELNVVKVSEGHVVPVQAPAVPTFTMRGNQAEEENKHGETAQAGEQKDSKRISESSGYVAAQG